MASESVHYVVSSLYSLNSGQTKCN